MTALPGVPAGTGWIDAAPEHWRVAPLGAHFDERKEVVSDVQFPPLSVTKQGVVPQVSTAAKTINNDSRKLVRRGDFAINSRSDRKGSSGLSPLDGSVSVVYTVLRPRASVDGRFVHHLLRSSTFQEEFYRWGNGIVDDLWSTRYSAMKGIPLAIPPLQEQRAIADFLDRETARIDTLISEQQRLIELLHERRRSVLDGAFVDRAGSAPTRLRRILSARPGYGVLVPQYDDADGSVPLVRVGDILRLEAERELPRIRSSQSAEYARTELRGGEVLLGVVGKMGQAALVPNWLAGANVARAVAVLRCTDVRNARLLVEWIGTTFFRDQAALATSGDSVQPTLGMADLARFSINWPDDEQRAERMAHEIGEQTAKIDRLIAETERFIVLSKERRAALITAAVTGHIDVREPVGAIDNVR